MRLVGNHCIFINETMAVLSIVSGRNTNTMMSLFVAYDTIPECGELRLFLTETKRGHFGELITDWRQCR